MAKKEEYITPAEALKRWLKGEKKIPPVLKDFNPLQARPGDSVKIETPELLKYTGLAVSLVDIYVRVIAGKTFRHVDYVLVDDTTEEKEVWVTLRVNPVETLVPGAPVKTSCLLLFPHEEREWNDEMRVLWEEVLPQGALSIVLPDGSSAVYSRVEGLTEPYVADVVEYKSADGPAEPAEAVAYYDFVREVKPDALEYYFIERNEATGMIQGFFGKPVADEDVKFLRSLVKK